MNHAIFLAGGTGKRTESDIPKQYVRAGGYMMATYAIKPLLESKAVDDVYVVANEDWHKEIYEDARKMGLNVKKIKGFAMPGVNRQASILSGMKEILRGISKKEDIEAVSGKDTVLVHDAARPFLDFQLLKDIYAALSGHDGVMPVIPMKDTVYYSENGKTVSKLLDRQKVVAGQAPELFNYKKYYEANVILLPDKIFSINGATEPAIIAGMDIAMISGNEKNFKVTTAADLDRFMQLKEEKQ
ncbi:IspD/TarI family cytidylyltransferase [Butyrivibrio sp. LB2008]|uniref:IspD/TarI family cytidylyltransferase n=1 Tax=Butyrivibrio sp. LB2008 TaxID=1408305 RepID=UPI00047EE5EB|nr:IspD/TarI family cytidylyltransferase [Butyrivibrio sp. LB2008]